MARSARGTFAIFEEASQYVLDPYWKDILQNCANGRFPPGVRYTSHTHVFSIKTQKKGKTSGGIEMIELRSDPLELSQDVLRIFREKLELFSNVDLKVKEDEFEVAAGQHSSIIVGDVGWKSIKPKHMKDLYVTNYVIGLKKKYNISDQDAAELNTNIAFAIQLKTISPEQIHFEHNAISHIDGVEYSPHTGKVTLSIPKGKVAPIAKGKRSDSSSKDSILVRGVIKYAKANNNRVKAITEFV
jgi:hypothetical protein